MGSCSSFFGKEDTDLTDIKAAIEKDQQEQANVVVEEELQEAEAEIEESATEEVIFEIEEMALRRANQDMYQIEVYNNNELALPLAALKVKVGEDEFFSTVLSFNAHDIKFAMLQNVGKLRPKYKIETQIIKHHLPISFPKEKNLIIASSLSLALVLEMQYIYSFDVDQNEFIVISDDKESQIYKTAFQEHIQEFEEYIINTTTDDLIIKTRETIKNLKNLLMSEDATYENIIILGPIWLWKLIEKITNNRKFTYGYQLLAGCPIDKKVNIGRFVRIWMEDISQYEDYDEIDLAIDKWFEIDSTYDDNE